jgi:hypothetical protein
MSQSTHEPPDPELWGRVVEIVQHLDDHTLSIHSCPPTPESSAGEWQRVWWSVFISRDDDNGSQVEVDGFGSTWNDAARALIAEWEGRQ